MEKKELVTSEWDYEGIKSSFHISQKDWNQTLNKVITETSDKIKSDKNIKDTYALFINPKLKSIFSCLEYFQEVGVELENFDLYGKLGNRFFIITSKDVNEKDKIFISDSSILKQEKVEYDLLGYIKIKNFF